MSHRCTPGALLRPVAALHVVVVATQVFELAAIPTQAFELAVMGKLRVPWEWRQIGSGQPWWANGFGMMGDDCGRGCDDAGKTVGMLSAMFGHVGFQASML